MARTRRITALGYYLIGFAAVLGLLAFSLLPAQADDGLPEKLVPPKTEFPTYPDGDKEIKDESHNIDYSQVSNAVKVGDKITFTFKNLKKGQLQYVRFSEPLEVNSDNDVVNKPRHELIPKRFKEGESNTTETFTYTVPCWSSTSKDVKDGRDIQVNLFYHDGGGGVAWTSVVVVPSKQKCQGDEKEPEVDENYNADVRPLPEPVAPEPGGNEEPDTDYKYTGTPKISINPDKDLRQGQPFTLKFSDLPEHKHTVASHSVIDPKGKTIASMPEGSPSGTEYTHLWSTDCQNWMPGTYTVKSIVKNDRVVPKINITKTLKFKLNPGKCPPSGQPGNDPKPPNKPDKPKPNKPKPHKPDKPKPNKPKPHKPSVKPDVDISLNVYNKAGKRTVVVPRNEAITIKTTYAKKASSVSFALHSQPVNLGSAVLKNNAAQISTMIPCSVPVGKHTLQATYEGKEPLIAKKAVMVTQGNCPTGVQAGHQKPMGSPYVNASTGSAPHGLAQTGTASIVLALLALASAGSGIVLLTSRRAYLKHGQH